MLLDHYADTNGGIIYITTSSTSILMQFSDLVNKAIGVRKVFEQYEKSVLGKTWSKENFAEGLVGDVGDLMKLVMAKEGLRKIKNVDEKLAHELSDCLWSIIVLAELYDIDLESSFIKTMDELEADIKSKIAPK